jgi:hypothetical protein
VWRVGLVFVDISFHRRGPDVLPASQFLLVLVLVTYFVVGVATLSTDGSPALTLALLFVDRLLYLGSAWAALRVADKPHRFMQTATALVGADIFLNLLSVPVLFWDDHLQASPEQLTPPRMLIAFLILWSIDVGGFILSRAMAKPYIVGVSVVLVYVLLTFALRDAILPMVD